MKKIVIAIGGNALGENPEQQTEIIKKTAKKLIKFIFQGNKIIIVHGNGPQVGMINNGFELGHKQNNNSPVLDFPICGAMSQAYIGYELQQALQNELDVYTNLSVVTLITQTVVDKKDDAFLTPTKPIGAFYSEEQAHELAKINKWNIMDDAGRGWRRVIASPMPVDIVEKEAIKTLVNHNFIVIAGGGGGVPVYINEYSDYQGIAAVIDKDFTAALIGEIIEADALIMLTAIDQVSINYKKENEEWFSEMNIALAKEFIKNNQFGKGSMEPKIQAAIKFVESTGNPAYIGSLEKIEDVLNGQSGTKFIE